MSTQTLEIPAPEPQPSLFKNRNFLLLWLAQVMSSLGDWALLIAIPVTVYDGTNDPAKLGLSFVAETVPALILGAIAGVLVDRWNRRLVMIASDLGRMLSVCLLLGVHHLDHLGHRGLWLIYGAAFLTSTFGCFFSPARSALMAALLPRERLMQATALSSSSIRLTQLLGPALAGVLLHSLHPHGVFVFDALTFLFAAGCATLVADPEVKQKAASGLQGVIRDLREGLSYLAPGTVLGNLISFLSFATLANGIFNVLLYAFVRDVLKISGAGFGYLLSAYGLGALLVVPLVAGPLKNAPPVRLIGAGFLLMGVGGVGFAYSHGAAMAAVTLFFSAIGNMLMFLPALTMCQSEPPPEVRGRVMGALITISAFFTAASSLAVAAFIGFDPPLRLIYLLLAGVYLVCGLLAYPMLSRKLDSERP